MDFVRRQGGHGGLFYTLEACDEWNATDWCWVLFCLPYIYIDDLDDNICGVVNKFAGDAKIDGVVVSEEGYLRLQWDMNQQEEWAREWQMEFNLDWCEVMHFEKLSNGRI